MRILTIFSLAFLIVTSGVQASGGVCRKCEALREYHKNNPSEYKFYEDYIEAVENGECDPEEGCPINFNFSQDKDSKKDTE